MYKVYNEYDATSEIQHSSSARRKGANSSILCVDSIKTGGKKVKVFPLKVCPLT